MTLKELEASHRREAEGLLRSAQAEDRRSAYDRSPLKAPKTAETERGGILRLRNLLADIKPRRKRRSGRASSRGSIPRYRRCERLNFAAIRVARVSGGRPAIWRYRKRLRS
jgi:hypothetical protein